MYNQYIFLSEEHLHKALYEPKGRLSRISQYIHSRTRSNETAQQKKFASGNPAMRNGPRRTAVVQAAVRCPDPDALQFLEQGGKEKRGGSGGIGGDVPY